MFWKRFYRYVLAVHIIICCYSRSPVLVMATCDSQLSDFYDVGIQIDPSETSVRLGLSTEPVIVDIRDLSVSVEDDPSFGLTPSAQISELKLLDTTTSVPKTSMRFFVNEAPTAEERADVLSTLTLAFPSGDEEINREDGSLIILTWCDATLGDTYSGIDIQVVLYRTFPEYQFIFMKYATFSEDASVTFPTGTDVSFSLKYDTRFAPTVSTNVNDLFSSSNIGCPGRYAYWANEIPDLAATADPDIVCGPSPTTCLELTNSTFQNAKISSSAAGVTTFLCDAGTALAGGQTTFTAECNDEGLLNATLTTDPAGVTGCVEVTCSGPPSAGNTFPFIPLDHQTEYTLGTTVQLYCIADYRGPTEPYITRTCQIDGTWNNGGDDSCTLITCDPSLFPSDSFGVTTIPRVTNINQDVAVTCNSGHHVRNFVNTYRVRCVDQGVWLAIDPAPCQVIACELPLPALVNANGPSEGSNATGTNVTYECKEGFTISPSIKTITLTCTLDNARHLASWNRSSDAVCQAILCSKGYLPSAGSLSAMSLTPDENFYNLGVQVSFKCLYGFTVNSSLNALYYKCVKSDASETGVWEADTNTCTAITCPDDRSSYDTDATLTGTGTAINTTVEFTCNTGLHTADGRNSYTHKCVQRGLEGFWLHQSISCTPLMCNEPPGDTTFITRHRFTLNLGSRSSYTCTAGHTINTGSPSGTYTCSNENLAGQWIALDNDDFYCEVSRCGRPPGANPNSSLLGSKSWYNIDAVVYYGCVYGYENEASYTYNRTCLANGWSDASGACSEITCVASPGPCTGGEHIYDGHNEMSFDCLTVDGTSTLVRTDGPDNSICTVISCDSWSGTGSFIEGSGLNYNCQTGLAQPNGDATFEYECNITIEHRGRLTTDDDGYCVLKTCSPPTDNFGVVMPSHTSYNYGTTVTVICIPGYKYGTNSLSYNTTCEVNWTLESACEPIMCDVQPQPNATYTVDTSVLTLDLRATSHGGATVIALGAVANYDCNTNFHASDGDATISFICKEDLLSGVLQPQGVPRCKPVRCGPPSMDAHIDSLVISQSPFDVGTTITLTCRDYYTISNTANTYVLTCSNVNAAGVWTVSPSGAECTPIRCGAPPAATTANGLMPLTSSAMQYDLWEEVEYDCTEGKHKDDHSAVVTVRCITDGFQGIWDPPDPSCPDITCNVPAVIPTSVEWNPTCVIFIDVEAATMTPDCSGADGSALGNLVNYTCPTGFAGDLHYACSKHSVHPFGIWNPFDTSATCTVQLCDAPPAALSSENAFDPYPQLPFYNHGVSVFYTCKPGFHVDDNVKGFERQCDASTNTWNTVGNQCTPIQCSSPPSDAVPNADASTSSSGPFNLGDTYRYDCNAGYHVYPGKNDLEFRCVHSGLTYMGEWIGPIPNGCIEVTCALPPAPAHTTTASTGPLNSGSTATFTCDINYSTPSGAPSYTVTCVENGNFYGELESTENTCQAILCEAADLSTPTSSYGPFPNKTSYNVGDSVRYTCHEGTRFSDGVNYYVRTCQADGSWSPNSEMCSAGSCPADGGGTSPVGESREIPCPQGQHVTDGVGAYTETCVETVSYQYEWFGADPDVCKAVTCDLFRETTYVTGPTQEDILVNTAVPVGCVSDTTYALENAGTSLEYTCTRSELFTGIWAGTGEYYCQAALCSATDLVTPDNAMSSSFIIDDYDSGAEVEYSCADGHHLQDGHYRLTVTCDSENTWSTPSTCSRIMCAPADMVDAVEPTGNAHTTETLTYQCDSGHSPRYGTDMASFFCVERSIAGVVANFDDVCDDIMCDLPPEQLHASRPDAPAMFALGGYITFTLEPGYILSTDDSAAAFRYQCVEASPGIPEWQGPYSIDGTDSVGGVTARTCPRPPWLLDAPSVLTNASGSLEVAILPQTGAQEEYAFGDELLVQCEVYFSGLLITREQIRSTCSPPDGRWLDTDMPETYEDSDAWEYHMLCRSNGEPPSSATMTSIGTIMELISGGTLIVDASNSGNTMITVGNASSVPQIEPATCGDSWCYHGTCLEAEGEEAVCLCQSQWTGVLCNINMGSAIRSVQIGYPMTSPIADLEESHIPFLAIPLCAAVQNNVRSDLAEALKCVFRGYDLERNYAVILVQLRTSINERSQTEDLVDLARMTQTLGGTITMERDIKFSDAHDACGPVYEPYCSHQAQCYFLVSNFVCACRVGYVDVNPTSPGRACVKDRGESFSLPYWLIILIVAVVIILGSLFLCLCLYVYRRRRREPPKLSDFMHEPNYRFRLFIGRRPGQWLTRGSLDGFQPALHG